MEFQTKLGTIPQRKGIGKAYGTFGELLQGVDTNDRDFLVTLPINRYSNVVFTSVTNKNEIIVFPSNRQKSKQLAELILNDYRLPMGGILEIHNNLLVGKGLASSSADLVATARAIDNCFSLNMSEEKLLYFIRQIEVTDGVMYEGVVSFYHRKVQLSKMLGYLSKLAIICLDEGGMVDTLQFNQLEKPFTWKEKEEYEYLLETISNAIRENNLKKLGEVSTRSAILNQKILGIRNFDNVLGICHEIEGIGVVITHSGTCIGILLSLEDPEYQRKLFSAFEELSKLSGEVHLFYPLTNK